MQSTELTLGDSVIENGVNQGCVLAPTLLDLDIQDIFTTVSKNSKYGIKSGQQISGRMLDGLHSGAMSLVKHTIINIPLHADSCCAFAHIEKNCESLRVHSWMLHTIFDLQNVPVSELAYD